MNEETIIHILRNPHGYNDNDQREAMLKAADKIEDYKDAYLNMRQFAEDNGLDTTTRN